MMEPIQLSESFTTDPIQLSESIQKIELNQFKLMTSIIQFKRFTRKN